MTFAGIGCMCSSPGLARSFVSMLDLAVGVLELLLEIGGRVAELLVRLEQLVILLRTDRLLLGGRSGDPRQAAARRQGPAEHPRIGQLQAAGSISAGPETGRSAPPAGPRRRAFLWICWPVFVS